VLRGTSASLRNGTRAGCPSQILPLKRLHYPKQRPKIVDLRGPAKSCPSELDETQIQTHKNYGNCANSRACSWNIDHLPDPTGGHPGLAVMMGLINFSLNLLLAVVQIIIALMLLLKVSFRSQMESMYCWEHVATDWLLTVCFGPGMATPFYQPKARAAMASSSSGVG